jgi:hypothetical protein
MISENIILIVLTSIILRYVLEVEEKSCTCATNKQQEFIKYFSPVVILVGLLGLFVTRKSMFNTLRNNRLLLLLATVYGFVAIIHSINMVVYFLRLRFSKCECARNWKQWGLLYPALALAVVLLVVFVFLVLSFLGLIPVAFNKITGGRSDNNSASELLNSLTNNKRGRK